MANVVFELFAKLGLDSSEYENGLGEAKTKANSVMDVIGKGFKTAAGIGAAAIGAATTAVGAFGMESIKSYANYEQLVGGVDKLYGNASKKLQGYANEAYKTAGMSANTYMETATQFSASLINSLGGDVDAAADMTDKAMRTMSDNVNVFGSNFEDVSNAFKGFARENYTMLDNLKLGYSGSKEGMLSLIEDANTYRASIGESSDLTIDSFADIITAIESVQEAQGIAGTTGKEAMKTLEGSATATKAAWQNVITAIAGGGDLSAAMDSLITSVFGEAEGEGLLNQIIPRIEVAMEGIGDFIATAAPYITEKIPELIAAILPSMVSAGLELLSTVGQTIINTVPALMGSIFSEIDSAISNSSFGSAWDGIKSSASTAVESIKSSFGTLAETFTTTFQPAIDLIGEVIDKIQEWIESGEAANDVATLFSTGISLIGEGISSLLDGLTSAIELGVKFAEWVTSGSDSADMFNSALVFLVTTLGILKGAMIAQTVAATAHQVAMLAMEGATKLVTAAQAAFNAVLSANPIGLVIAAIAGFVAALVYLYENNETVREAINEAWAGIVEAFNVFVEAIETGLYAIGEFIVTQWENIVNYFNAAVASVEAVLYGIGETLVGAWTSVVTMFNASVAAVEAVLYGIGETLVGAWDGIVAAFNASVATVEAILYGIGETLVGAWTSICEGVQSALSALGEFIVSTWNTVSETISTTFTAIQTVVQTILTAISTVVLTLLNNILQANITIWGGLFSMISTKMDNIKTKITTVWTNIKTSITSAITLIKSTVTNGFTTMVSNLTTPLTNMKTAITGAFNSVKDTISGVIDSALTWGSDLIDNFVSGIKNNISKVGDAIGSVADKIKSLIGFSEPEDGPLSRFHTFAPDMMELFAQGIDQSAYLVTDALKRNFDFYDDIVKPLNMDGSGIGLTSSRSGDFNETINIYAPTALDPSEVARQTRKANREMMLALRGI